MDRSFRYQLFALSALLALARSAALAAPKFVVPAFAISEIQIELFYVNSGRFSTNLAKGKI